MLKKEVYLPCFISYSLEITSVAVTPDNKYLISGSRDRSLKIFDFDTKQQVHHLEKANEGKSIHIEVSAHCLDSISSLVVTSDNRFLIFGSFNNSIKVFDLATKQQVYHVENAHQRKLASIETLVL